MLVVNNNFEESREAAFSCFRYTLQDGDAENGCVECRHGSQRGIDLRVLQLVSAEIDRLAEQV